MTTPAERARALEAAIRTHPAVRDVRAIVRPGPTGAPQLSCWVVADDAALEVPAISDLARVRKWGKVFDLMHGAPTSAKEPSALPQPAWTSTFTRQPFPAEELQDWVDATVRLVRSLSPKRVLELGCGSGVLVSRLAPSCLEYVGTDLSGRSLETLARYLGAIQPPLKHVRLLERPAEVFEDLGDAAFDTAIVNSVVQYFPDEAYLRRVLDGASRVVRPGGALLIGDVRNLAVLEPFCAAVELHRAPAGLTLDEVEERVRRRLATLDELVLAPEFFSAFARSARTVARVDLAPKRGRFTNEFSAYRYEVVLRLGPKETPIAASWIDWTPEWTLDAITARLGTAPTDRLALRGVANLRVEPDVVAWRLIRDRACGTVAELRAMTARRTLQGLSPEDLHLLGERAGVRVQLSVAGGDSDGRFDVVFDRSTEPVAWPEAAPGAKAYNEPGLNVRRQALVGPLLLHVQPLLDAASLPASITVSEQLPRE